MITFKDYISFNNVLIESTGIPKLHLSHLEDLLVEMGKQGFYLFKQQVLGLLNYLSGLESETVVNLKVDGAPALYFGKDPREEYNGEFFIAMKAAFAKDPKIIHNIDDIEAYYGGRGDLTEKLKSALSELSKVYGASGDDRIFQGDLLFATLGDKRLETIDGQHYITFKPNTIKYAIPVDAESDNYNAVKGALLGIFVHDSFHGSAMGNNINTTPAGKNIQNLIQAGKETGVYIGSSSYEKVNIDISQTDKSLIEKWMKIVESNVESITDEFNNFYINSRLLDILKRFLNNEVKKDPPNVYTNAVSSHGEYNEDEFSDALNEFFDIRQTAESEGKGPRGVANAQKRFDELRQIIEDPNFKALIIATYYMIKIKGVFVNIFNKVESKLGKSFLQQPDGSWEITPGEGFVLFIGDNQVKLVDRLDFSKANLMYGKFQK
jgi:hypothetical protein